MSTTIWGLLQVSDANTPVQTVGQQLTFEAINRFAARHNTNVGNIIRRFVDDTTTDIETYYETPGGGMMQETNRLSRPGAVKTYGRYNVGFPIRDARDQIAGDDITFAYLTLAQLQRQVTNIFIRHLNWVRFHILRALFNNANETFFDEFLQREITVRRLANTDGTIYAPNLNAETGTDDNHYLVSGYLSSAISNTNNPFITLRDEITEHSGDGNIVVFINPAQSAVVKALADFVGYTDPMIRLPTDSTVITGAAPDGLPGTVIGRVSSVWVVEWTTIPADYMVALDISQPPPLRKRIDIATNIQGRGQLALIARQQEFPLEESFWRDRHGYGVGNRLGTAIMQFKASGTYDIPAAYA
jgi:hypothetical protein